MESIHHAIFKLFITLFVIDIFNVCSISVQTGFDPDSKFSTTRLQVARGLTVTLNLLLQDSQSSRFVGVNLIFGSTPKIKKIQCVQIQAVGCSLMRCAQADDTISKQLVEQVDGFTYSVQWGSVLHEPCKSDWVWRQ